MNNLKYADAQDEEQVKSDCVNWPFTSIDLYKMSKRHDGDVQTHAECEMIWTQVNQ